MKRFTPTRRRSEAGFTLMEILVTLVVFSISIVGLVAIQSRSIETEKAANQIRNAERIAAEDMANLMSMGFNDLVLFDFQGNPNPNPANIAYDDLGIPGANRLRDYRRPPADVPPSQQFVGSTQGTYVVARRVTFVCNVNPINPCIQGNPQSIAALNLEVFVQWVDDTNPTFPPPDNLRIENVTPDMSDPTSANFEPFIGHVELSTVRVNDGVITTPAGLPPPPPP